MKVSDYFAVEQPIDSFCMALSDFQPADLTEVCVRLGGIKTLTRVSFAASQLFDQAARDIAQMLRMNHRIASLNLGSNYFTSVLACTISGSLQHLLVLDLRNNQIGSEGACAIAHALRENIPLRYLDLASNRIHDEGAASLAEALCHNCTLTWLSLRSNIISGFGAEEFCVTLKENRSLRSFDISFNPIAFSARCSLKDALWNYNTVIIEYRSDVSGVQKEVPGVSLSDILVRNRNHHLSRSRNCSRCIISLLGVRKLHRAHSGIWMHCPREILAMIAIQMWQMRHWTDKWNNLL